MTRYVIWFVVALCAALPQAFGQQQIQPQAQSQTAAQDPWTDYAAGEYSIRANITYATANNTPLKLDLYIPKKKNVPVLVLFHGGGWVAGQKEQNVLQLLPYLSLGWAVVNVEYRLGSASPAPAAVEDCLCALRWVGRNAAQYGFDTARIVVTGGSAGGHLALITGMLPAESPFYRSCPTGDETRWNSGTEPRVRVAAIVNWFGICDVADLLDGPNAKHYAMEWFGSMNNPKELARQLSPLTYAGAGSPPTFTVHGDSDDIVPYAAAVKLHSALENARIPNKLLTIKGGGHGGFDRKTLVSSFAAIRDFLRANGILRPE